MHKPSCENRKGLFPGAEGAPEHLPTAPVPEGGWDLRACSLAVAVDSKLASSTARGLLELAVRGNPCQLPLC